MNRTISSVPLTWYFKKLYLLYPTCWIHRMCSYWPEYELIHIKGYCTKYSDQIWIINRAYSNKIIQLQQNWLGFESLPESCQYSNIWHSHMTLYVTITYIPINNIPLWSGYLRKVNPHQTISMSDVTSKYIHSSRPVLPK